MKFGLALSIILSATLIGATSWHRFGNTQPAAPAIVALEQVNTEDAYDHEEILRELNTPRSTSTPAIATPPKPLTNTDIVTRNLLLSYMDLSAKGGATEQNLESLADAYVGHVGDLHVFKRAEIQELKAVPNNTDNLKNYANGVMNILLARGTRLNDASIASNLYSAENGYRPFMQSAGIIYEDTALALKNLPVPTPFLLSHLKLVNGHLSTSAGMKALYNLDEDPLTAIAGLAAITKSDSEEAKIIEEIDQAMMKTSI